MQYQIAKLKCMSAKIIHKMFVTVIIFNMSITFFTGVWHDVNLSLRVAYSCCYH